MQFNKIFFMLTIVCSIAINSNAQEMKSADEVCYNPNAKFDSSKKSINAAAVGKIGAANVTISYHSPGVRGRTIWGGLVPYNDVWVTGAHSATSIEIDKDFVVAGTALSKGKYAIFTIPGKEEWTIIINKNWEQHLMDDYSEKEDLVRIKVTPTVLNENLERLQYFIQDEKNGQGKLAIAWEKIRVQFDIITK